MKREIMVTSDGSTTLHLPDWGEQYHSKHGAIQEAFHVFIKNGLDLFKDDLSILEIGFGTGLNAFITFLEGQKRNLSINYCGVEAYPVTKEEVALLNYVSELNAVEERAFFDKIHEIPWEQSVAITEQFMLRKEKKYFEEITAVGVYNLIYFDAFGATHQPDLWGESMFQIMYTTLKNNGVLVTYSAKGSVRRALQAVGFVVERLDGPPGKREMLRATKKIKL